MLEWFQLKKLTLVFAFLAIVFAGPAFSGQQGALLQFLSRFPEISIPFTRAPGRGHFATTVLLMKQIRESGYLGKFHLRICPSVRTQVAALLPGYDPAGNPVQYLPDLNADTQVLQESFGEPIQVSSFAIMPPFQTLGIVGGEDRNLPPSAIGVDALVVVQPSNWWAPAELRVSTPKADHAFYSYDFLELGNSRVWADYQTPESPLEWIRGELAKTPSMRSKLGGLEELIRSRGSTEILSAYGLEFQNGPMALSTAVAAAKKLGRPTLVLVLNDLSREGWESFEKYHRFHDSLTGGSAEAIEMAEIEDESGLRKKMRNMKGNSVLIVKVGAVPQPVFNYLMDESTLPPLAEGNTTVDFLSLRGKVFFSTTGNLCSETPEVSAFSKKVSIDLKFPGGADNLADYMRQSLDPQSELVKMFKRNQEKFLKKPDKLDSIVSAISRATECSRLLVSPFSSAYSTLRELIRRRLLSW